MSSDNPLGEASKPTFYNWSKHMDSMFMDFKGDEEILMARKASKEELNFTKGSCNPQAVDKASINDVVKTSFKEMEKIRDGLLSSVKFLRVGSEGNVSSKEQ